MVTAQSIDAFHAFHLRLSRTLHGCVVSSKMFSYLKIKCVIIALTVTICMASRCTRQFIDCNFDVYCDFSTFDIQWNILRDAGQGENCENTIYINYGYRIPPVSLVLGDISDKADVIPEFYDSNVASLIVSLDISRKQLKRTPILNGMNNLKIMNVSYNNLRVAKLFNENELSKLENVDLSHNLIDSIYVDVNYYVYTNLRSLNLSHNYVSYIPDGTFETCNVLETLDLSYNNLAIINHYSFDGLRNLKFLYLSSNNISSINLSLFRFSHLEELYLDNNNVEKLYEQDFDNLHNLRILNLDFNKIDQIKDKTFNNLLSLTTIKMHHNLISNIYKDALIFNNNLKIVDFSSNLISSLPKNLFRYKNITSFFISDNILKGSLSRGIFEGLQLIKKLDIGFQQVNAIEEYAFFGLEKLEILLLNNNLIRTISKLSFKTLKNLNLLDLSNNFIISLDFDKTDLLSLESLSLKKNIITQIQLKDLNDLKRLQLIDITSNNISHVEPDSFKSLESVHIFRIFENPLSGALMKNTFQGLILPRDLDLSCTMLTSVENGSLYGMVELQQLNVSHSLIETLEFNAFTETGNINLIDLSYNKLNFFNVNCSDVKNLTTLILNNNYLVHISNNMFKGMHILSKVLLSYNYIESIDNAAFENQIDLRYLDLSFNYNLTFPISAIDKTRSLENLLISGLKDQLSFKSINISSLRLLDISDSFNIFNVSELHLNTMTNLENLVLKNNSLAQLEVPDFTNMNGLKFLDLSFNHISSIQPGTFKDNIFLYKLNLSHNLISSLGFGIFRGLTRLGVLDISYNNIRDLNRARFYDTSDLKVLIADNNKVMEISEDFVTFRLDLLSIGDNPLACEKISYMKYKQKMPVSAINKDETNKHNIDGITCENNNKHVSEINNINNINMSESVLLDIRNVLLNISKNNARLEKPKANNLDINLLQNMSNTIHNLETDQIKEQIQLKNVTSRVGDKIEITNSFLERILKVIVGLGTLKGNSVKAEKNNITDSLGNNTMTENSPKLNALITEVSEVKQELLYLENIISEIDTKIIKINALNSPFKSETANKTDVLTAKSTNGSFIFVEVCVSLILILMICFLAYKFYRSKMFMSTSRSLSTRRITESMDNSNL